MKPDNRLTVRYGLKDAEYLAESSGNDTEIDLMILISESCKPISQLHPIGVAVRKR